MLSRRHFLQAAALLHRSDRVQPANPGSMHEKAAIKSR